MLSASSRSSLAVAKRAPAGWVAVEATSRPRQFGYETPQLRLEGIVPNYPIGRLTVRAALRGRSAY